MTVRAGRSKLQHVRRQENAQKLIAYLHQRPIITIKLVSELLGTQANTASKLVADFSKLGILRELTGRRRNRLFIFDEYTRIFID
ncbi:MAG: hypothetical protein KAT52_01965 [Desulfobacterales bacterium]|jgi:Fic family protein|nr:hypothetical protein [Desulfobacterales bacterium]MDL2123894.1 hypothetical protein [Deltaproteobacteria bacterium]